MTLVKMHKFRKYFGGGPTRCAGGLEVEGEGKRGFKDRSGVWGGLLRFPPILEGHGTCVCSVLCLGVP